GEKNGKKLKNQQILFLPGAQGAIPWAQGAAFSTRFAVCCLFPAQRTSRAARCASFSGKCRF
ncbi:hypothetical protein A2U01_0119227, partial [Trifolium medium]|nr:hypothetical protein [Trifolium medium]